MNVPFCSFVHNLTYEMLPKDVRNVMIRTLLDTIGVAAVGSRTKISSITRQYACHHMAASQDGPSARLLFDGRFVSPVGAAMAGAATIDSIDAHDGYGTAKVHAASCLLPSLFALADELLRQGKTLTGRELITAMAIGYEVGYRAGFAMNKNAIGTEQLASGAPMALGVAATCAKLLGLTQDQLRHAIGIAEYNSPRCPMMRVIDHPTMLRDGVSWGAPTGLSAAYLAQYDFTGAPALAVESEDTTEFWSDLGERWDINYTYFKPFPVCRWAHAPIEAADTLMKQHNLTSTDIERVSVQTFHHATRLAGHEPKTLDELSYGLAFPVAIMIVRGQIGVAELNEEILHDEEVLRISKSMKLVDCDHYSKISTRLRWADVTLYLKDGRQFQSEPHAAKGDPENPLSDQEISTKFHMLADPVIGVKKAMAIERLVPHITDEDFDLVQLFNLILTPLSCSDTLDTYVPQTE